MPNASKSKGNNAEKECAKIFANIFGGSWLRTPTSGAITGRSNNWRAKTMSKSQLLTSTNDITPPDEYSKCAIECKAYKDFEFHHMYRPEGINVLNKWIDQVKESGVDLNNDIPLICFKPNRKGWFIVIDLNKISNFEINKIAYSKYYYKEKAYLITDMLIFLETFTNELKQLFS